MHARWRAQPFALDTALDPKAGTIERGRLRLQGPAAATWSAGDTLLLNDGQIVLDVDERRAARASRRACASGGELSDRKGLNRQGGGISAPALSDKDREDIRFAAEVGVDYLAVSFARDAADIEQARALLRAAGGEARIVAKIERHEAIDNLAGIIEAVRRRHGGARRSGRGDGLRGAHRPAEDHHPPEPRRAIAWSSPPRR